ncbi:MAG TPA: CDP-alcohol phosphatidyltransferase family protein [Anaeromyxobacter sp.]
MGDSSRLAIVLLLGTAAATAGVYAVVRPTAPERMKAYGGPIGVLGRWAYFVTRPLLRAATALRLTANMVTAVGAALSIAAGAAAASVGWGWAGLLLVFGSWCDLIDGEIARATSTQGKAGAFLDSNLDRLSEIAIFSGLAASFPDRTGPFWATFALAASLMVSYARARGEGLGVECPNFGMERPHRVVLLMFALLFAPFLPGRGGGILVEAACAAIALGASATAIGRMVVIHRRLRVAEQGEVKGRTGRLGS